MTKARRKSIVAKKRYSRNDLINTTNIVPNNPDHPDEEEDDEDLGFTLYDSRNHRIWERLNYYRSLGGYYKTKAGHYKQHDEPGERDSEEVRIHNQALANRSQHKRDARERLKRKGLVPSKQGNPMWEQYQINEETISQFYMAFRALYYSGRTMRFKQWLDEIGDLIDNL